MVELEMQDLRKSVESLASSVEDFKDSQAGFANFNNKTMTEVASALSEIQQQLKEISATHQEMSDYNLAAKFMAAMLVSETYPDYDSLKRAAGLAFDAADRFYDEADRRGKLP